MDEATVSIINDYLKHAHLFIQTGQRVIELCTLLLAHNFSHAEVDMAFAWLEHSTLSPTDIINKLLT